MGDRARVVFNDGKKVSPNVYLHLHGNMVPEFISGLDEMKKAEIFEKAALPVDYATGRFIGIAHEAGTPGILSLAVEETAPELKKAILNNNEKVIADFSPGDAGIVVVNSRDFTWKAYGGYLGRDNVEYEDEDIESDLDSHLPI